METPQGPGYVPFVPWWMVRAPDTAWHKGSAQSTFAELNRTRRSPGISLPGFCCSCWQKPAVWHSGTRYKLEVDNYVTGNGTFGSRVLWKHFSILIFKISVLRLTCAALQCNDWWCGGNLSTLHRFLCKLCKCSSLGKAEGQHPHTASHSQICGSFKETECFHDTNLGKKIKDLKISSVPKATIVRSPI